MVQVFNMKSKILLLSLVVGVVLLGGCKSKGSSAPPPTNVAVVAGDSSATVTWDMAPGVQYWVFLAPTANVTPQNCGSIAGCQIITNAVSPLTISAPYNGGSTGFTTNSGVIGMTNGTTFSVSINGRIDSGPGGTGSAAVSFVPRLAGITWAASTAGTADLLGVAKGTATVAGVTGDVLVAVGNAGSLYSSTDGMAWAAPVSGVPVTSSLNAATANGTTYVVAGAGGVILTSSDALSWAQKTSGTANDLFSVASNGSGAYVAVGANGTILTSADGSGNTWTAATSGTTRHLYGITWANGWYVAVGQAGTMLQSSDGATWSAITPSAPVTADLKSVAYGGASTSLNVTSGTNTFVAVGNAGALVTSIDNAATWVTQTPITSSPNLNAVSYGHQFIAVGNGGAVYTSLDGLAWQVQNAGTANNLYAIKNRKFDYSAAGAAGTTLFAK